ncbi:MAG: hypothetical protein ACK4Z6_07850, partial [Candidatus Methylomirabilales bacterium]
MRSASILRAIERDRTSGARELAEKAAEAVLAFLEEHKDLPPKALLERLERLSLRLLRAQPAMAPLINFTDRLWLQAEREEARLHEALAEEAAPAQAPSEAPAPAGPPGQPGAGVRAMPQVRKLA